MFDWIARLCCGARGLRITLLSWRRRRHGWRVCHWLMLADAQGSQPYHQKQVYENSKLIWNVYSNDSTSFDWLWYTEIVCDYDIEFTYKVVCH